MQTLEVEAGRMHHQVFERRDYPACSVSLPGGDILSSYDDSDSLVDSPFLALTYK